MKRLLAFLLFLGVLGNLARATIHYDTAHPETPDYNNLETVVRLKAAGEPTRLRGLGDFLGLEFMIETRDTSGACAWFAKVGFTPEDPNADFSKAVKCLPSQVRVLLCHEPDYYSTSQTYHLTPNVLPDRPQTRPTNENRAGYRQIVHNSFLPGPNGYVNKHIKALSQSLFEWKLDRLVSITDFLEKLNEMKVPRGKTAERFPDYNLYGYTADGGALNCVTFSLALVKKFTERSMGEALDTYIDHYNEQTRLGKSSRLLSYLGGLTGGSGGALAYMIATTSSPPLVLLSWGVWAGGPVVFAGATACASAVLMGGFLGQKVMGKSIKYLFDKTSEVCYRVTAEDAIKELYRLGTQIVVTRTSQDQIFDNILLHTERNQSTKVQPPEAQYEFC